MGEKLNFVGGAIGLLVLLGGTVFWLRHDLKRLRSLKRKLRLGALLTQAEKDELASLQGKYPWA